MSNTIEVKIPDIGDISDAEIIEISVAVGDTVDVEDTLIVLETEKASMDVPSPHAGEVVNIQCSEGDKVGEGAAILTLSAGEATQATPEPVAEPEPVIESTPEPQPVSEPEAKQPEATVTAVATEQDLIIPDLGQDEAVDVIEVMIAEGDEVEVDQALVTLETEKASMEVPSSLSGKVISLSIAVGDKVSSGDVVGKILASAPDAESEPAAPTTPAEPEPAPEVASPEPVAESTPAKAPVPDYPAIQSGPDKGAIYASPAIRRFARELGADLSKIKGSGKKGRVLKEDVQQFVKYELSRPKANANSGAGSVTPADLPVIDHSKFGDTEQIPLSRIQKISSVNLHRNWVMIPHVTQHEEADITEMEAFRQEMKNEAMNEGVRLTPLAFMMKAVVASLKAFPRFNASLANDGENLILKKYFHIGVAVDTPDGLVVPVIRDVDQKSIYELATELGEVSAKAREKKLGIDAMQGGCFSISSLGGIGGTSFTPIVNWPDVAILGVSKSQMKPVWNGESFEPRLMLPLSLSYDHRVIDGALAAKFTSHLAQQLGDIRRLLLK